MRISENLFNLETELSFEILEKANILKSQGKDIINLGIGQPDFSTPKNIVEAGIKALRDGHHGYTPTNGIPELRNSVAEYIYDYYKININPDNILITPGGKPTIFISILIFGNKNSEIIYPDPGFPIYRSMIKYSGAKAVPLELNEKNNFEIDVDHLISLINEKTNLIIINNPNNPTGSFMEKSKIDKIIKKLEEFPNVAILSDEIYSRIIFDNNKMPSLIKYESIKDRLILLDGFSKTFCMTGWRLGWSIWPEKFIKHAIKLCVNNHSCVTSISQYAGIEALKGPKENLKKIIFEFEKRRDYIFNNINKINNIDCFKPGGAFYAFPNISKTGYSGKQYSKIALEKYGVALVPSSSFGNIQDNYVRISYANSIINIEKALDRLSNI